MKRVIMLADANSFFASCHIAEQSELENKEVIVAGDPKKRTGIVLAASYPAKAKGVKTGMARWEAERICPDAFFFTPDYSLYVEYSTKILKIMRNFTDLVESFSIDEAFLDCTGVLKLFDKTPLQLAQHLMERIKGETRLPCSIGIGPNKLIAKMAAELKKPNGISLVKDIEQYKVIFWPKPVRDLFGVGHRYEKHFRYLNIHTIGDLAQYPLEVLKKRWGKNGELLWYCANGIDNSPVVPSSLDTCKSVGNQRTLPHDVKGFRNIKVILYELSELITSRARRSGYVGRTVFLTLRDTQLNFLSRSMHMPDYSDLPEDIYETACKLLQLHWDDTWPVRLVGLALSNLIKPASRQMDLFGRKEKQLKIAKTCDSIRDRFGYNAIFRGISLTEGSLHGLNKRQCVMDKTPNVFARYEG